MTADQPPAEPGNQAPYPPPDLGGGGQLPYPPADQGTPYPQAPAAANPGYTPGYDQTGGYGQPPPAGYGQPPAAGYGQPPPAGYGQPPPGYPGGSGQPPPGYPPAQGYGQQAPAYNQPAAYPYGAPAYGAPEGTALGIPVYGQPTAYGVTTVYGNNFAPNRWKIHFWEFHQHLATCCFACWCPCYRIAQTVSRAHLGRFSKTLLLFGAIYIGLIVISIVEQYMRNTTLHRGPDGRWQTDHTKALIQQLMFVAAVILRLGDIILRTRFRGSIRMKYGINAGGVLGDCCLHWFCEPCALTQEAVQVDLVEFGHVTSCDFSSSPPRRHDVAVAGAPHAYPGQPS